MTTLSYITAAILASFVICLIVGRFMRAGAGPDLSQDDQLIDTIERAMPVLEQELDRLGWMEQTVDTINQRARIHVALSDAELAPMTLKQRRALG